MPVDRDPWLAWFPTRPHVGYGVAAAATSEGAVIDAATRSGIVLKPAAPVDDIGLRQADLARGAERLAEMPERLDRLFGNAELARGVATRARPRQARRAAP